MSSLNRARNRAAEGQPERVSAVLDVLRRRQDSYPRPKRSTYVVEALLLFICVMMVIAVVMSLFAFAARKGSQAALMEDAVSLASNIAEKFHSDPLALQDVYSEGELDAVCSMSLSMDSAGTLYRATISVSNSQGELYSLNTSRYVSFTGNVEDASAVAPMEEAGWDFE